LLKRDPGCTLCRLHQTTDHVCLLGQGPVPCSAMIIGEAPGYNEEQTGRVFVGRAGQLLRQLLKQAGLPPEETFICNVVSCRPPDNKKPTEAQIRECRHWLDHQLQQVNPDYVLLLGNVPLKALLGQTKITKWRGKVQEEHGRVYVPAFHPAYILRNDNQRPALEADVRLFADIVRNQGLPEEPGLNPVVVDSWDLVEEMLEAMVGNVSYDIEATGLDPLAEGAAVTALGFGTRDTQWIIPFKHRDYHPWSEEDLREILTRVDKRLPDCILSAHFGKFDSRWMRIHYGVRWEHDFDTGLAHHLLDENSLHGLEYLAQIYFGAVDYSVNPVEASWDKLYPYHARDCYYTRKLKLKFSRMLAERPDLLKIFRYITMPCSAIFTDAEVTGVTINVAKMAEAEKHLREKIRETEHELNRIAAEHECEVNWNSYPQVSDFLFEELRLTPLDKTDSGGNSTNESVLKRLNHPAATQLLRHRKATTQLGFFIKGWKPHLHRRKLHPSFKLHGTVTGRPSCENPNLQQTDKDPVIRSLVTAPRGWVLVEADLSQIELRIAAELAQEQTMLQAFHEGTDIHWLTAITELERGHGNPELVQRTVQKYTGDSYDYGDSIEYLLEMGPKLAAGIDKEWKHKRFLAKAVNFGYVYGMGAKTFLTQLRDDWGITITLRQAQESRDAYFQLYRDLEPWHERIRRYVRHHGYVTSLVGRVRRLPEAQVWEDTPQRGYAERQAINFPVQSFGNELNLMSLIQIREEFSLNKVRPCGTVHDSILLLIRPHLVEKTVPRILEIMSHPALLDTLGVRVGVPIEAEAKIGPWGKGVELDEWLKRRAA